MSPRSGKSRTALGQGDLFVGDEQVFPVRRPVSGTRPVDTLRIKTNLGEALKAHPDTAEVIAAKISELTGRSLTSWALYKYTQQSDDDHDIGLSRFVAFVRVTQAWWLWDELVKDDGLLVVEGRQAKLAQLGLLQQQHERVGKQMRDLKRELGDAPVDGLPLRRPRGGR